METIILSLFIWFGFFSAIICQQCELSSSVHFAETECGKKYTLNSLGDLSSPSIRVTIALNEESLYTMFLVDPDAPSVKGKQGLYWLHYIATNLKGNELENGITAGSGACNYSPPTPPPGTNYHRYQFMLFKQIGSLNLAGGSQCSSTRNKFKLDEFIQKHDLEDCVAGCEVKISA